MIVENSAENLLTIKNLLVAYDTIPEQVIAVDKVSFAIRKSEILGLAGESGCGKSTIAYSITRLLKSPGKVLAGEIIFQGENLVGKSERELQDIRWQKISIVLQSAMNNLNPVVTIQSQLVDGILAHEKMSKRQAVARAYELLALVNVPADKLQSYPHELSGGLRQRVGIAMALTFNPDLIILDEPTTALDLATQYKIMQEIKALRDRLHSSFLLITHDLPLMLEFCDRIVVMYAGRLVEEGQAEQIINDARHPYTSGLMNSFPRIKGRKKKLAGIEGTVPDLRFPPAGCRFYERCKYAQDICSSDYPAWKFVDQQHRYACIK